MSNRYLEKIAAAERIEPTMKQSFGDSVNRTARRLKISKGAVAAGAAVGGAAIGALATKVLSKKNQQK